MIRFIYLQTLWVLILFFASNYQANAQANFPLKDPGKIFKKQERKSCPNIKTRYFFETGLNSGREYLRQQDMLDNKGKMKSSGTFSEEGNKVSDIRYFYDPSGIMVRKEQRFISSNQNEITYYGKNGAPEKLELKTKTDSLISAFQYLYNEKGYCIEKREFRGNKLVKKQMNLDLFNEMGEPIQLYQFELDSNGIKIGPDKPFMVFEYDDQGMVLQITEYKNQDKRKMLNWIYFKYQLDNDYRIIRKSGFNEEQLEVSRTDLVYTDSSIALTDFKLCNCPSKTLEKQGSKLMVFNIFGEQIKETLFDKEGAPIQNTYLSYDDYGNCVDKITQKTSEPDKRDRSKVILEFFVDQAKALK